MKPDDPQLTAYAFGELTDPAARARVEAALAADPALQASVEELRATARLLEDAFAAEPLPSAENTQDAASGAVSFPSPKSPKKRTPKAFPKDSEPLRRARLVQLMDEAPALKRTKETHYGALTAAMAACLALAALWFFDKFTDILGGGADEAYIEVTMANPDDLVPRSPLAERIAAELAAEEAAAREAVERVLTEIATLDLREDEVVGGMVLPEPTPTEVEAFDLSPFAEDPLPAMRMVRPNLAEVGRLVETPVARIEIETSAFSQATGEALAFAAPPAQVRVASSAAPTVTAAPSPRSTPPPRDPQIAAQSYGDLAARVDALQAPLRASISDRSYAAVRERGFVSPVASPRSSFALKVDTGSYSDLRRLLLAGETPPATAVQIEELLNSFAYEPTPSVEAPSRERPFAVDLEIAEAPWEPQHQLVRIGLQGYQPSWAQRSPSNLVVLVETRTDDASVSQALRSLVERLDGRDRLAILLATEAGVETLLPSTPADSRTAMGAALDTLAMRQNGTLATPTAIAEAYLVARQHHLAGGNNQILLLTSGAEPPAEAARREALAVAGEAARTGVGLSVFQFGAGSPTAAPDHFAALAQRGGGRWEAVAATPEGQARFLETTAGLLQPIAQDVEAQVEFNPRHVQAYRLIGYENHRRNGETASTATAQSATLGGGHQVVALYEVIPVGVRWTQPESAPLRYQRVEAADESEEASTERLTVKVRYRLPTSTRFRELSEPLLAGRVPTWSRASEDFRWAAAVAGFGMILRDSDYRGQTDWELVERLARSSVGRDLDGRRQEFLEMIALARHQTPRRSERRAGG